jgi:hypothetical protein
MFRKQTLELPFGGGGSQVAHVQFGIHKDFTFSNVHQEVFAWQR